jgi:hypothetical protein
MLESYVKKILGSRVYDLAIESPLSPAPVAEPSSWRSGQPEARRHAVGLQL